MRSCAACLALRRNVSSLPCLAGLGTWPISGVAAASAYCPCTCSRVKMDRSRLRQCDSAAACALLAAFSCLSLHISHPENPYYMAIPYP